MKKSKYDIRRTINIEDLGKITTSQGAFNSIGLLFGEAAYRYESIGANALAKSARQKQEQIYTKLKEYGFYRE